MSYKTFSIKGVHPGWNETFKNASVELAAIDKILSKINSSIYPEKSDIFRAFNISPDDVKVVIFGQDPYPHMNRGSPTACGLAFSVRRKPKGYSKNSRDLPPSLVNIYKEIKNCYDDFVIPTHGDISCWEKQGVMLLNRGLTYSNSHNKRTHSYLWAGFMDYVLTTLSIRSKECIYLLWGKEAEELASGIKGTQYITSHPSPRSVDRGFEGCEHFLKVNKRLANLGLEEIDWTVPL